MSTIRATSRVQEIRNRTDAIQQKNAEKTQGTANSGQSSAGAVKSTAKGHYFFQVLHLYCKSINKYGSPSGRFIRLVSAN